MKLQTAEINVSFAIDFNEPKMSSSVFYYTQKPDVRTCRALWSTLQHNSIHQSEDSHTITQSLVPFTSKVMFILVFFFLSSMEVLELGNTSATFVSHIPFTTISAWWTCRYKNQVENSNYTNWNLGSHATGNVAVLEYCHQNALKAQLLWIETKQYHRITTDPG